MTTPKVALITGVTGQDGAYLAEYRNFILHYGDMTDSSNLIRIVQQVQPDGDCSQPARHNSPLAS